MTEVTPWPQFTDFAKSQGSAWLTDPKSVINEFQKHAYVWKFFMPGSEPHEFLRTGANIKSAITLEEQRTYGPYAPSELITFPQTQTGTLATSHWTQARAPLAWNQVEVELQAEGAFSTADRAQTFHNVFHEKMGNFMRGVSNAIDDEFFAFPTAAMESATGNTPRSLWMLFNEARTADWASAGSNAPVANGYWPGISTIAGIDPTDYLIPGKANQSYWGITQKSYSQLHSATTSNYYRAMEAGDLIFAIDEMILDTQWQPAPRAETYSVGNGNKVILTSRQGVQAIRQSLVSTSNDRWLGMAPNQMGGSITYDGHQVVRATGMETSRVYPNYGASNEADTILVASTRYTEGGYDSAGSAQAGCIVGPRFMFVDTSNICSFFHTNHFFKTTDPRMLFESRPDTYAMYLENWRNLHPKRLRSSGFLYPSADIAGVSYTA